jgi:hypothetical protein
MSPVGYPQPPPLVTPQPPTVPSLQRNTPQTAPACSSVARLLRQLECAESMCFPRSSSCSSSHKRPRKCNWSYACCLAAVVTPSQLPRHPQSTTAQTCRCLCKWCVAPAAAGSIQTASAGPSFKLAQQQHNTCIRGQPLPAARSSCLVACCDTAAAGAVCCKAVGCDHTPADLLLSW